MVFELYTELRNHIGGQDQYDDITLISFRRKLNKDADYHAIGRVAKLDYLGELRDFVEAAAVNCGLDSESVFTFKLVTEEMCTNIIQYGFVGQEPGFITMAFEKEEGKATLSIWDDGIYFSPDQVDTPDIGANWESRQIGGLGIYLVKELVDNVTYNSDENNNNVLVLEKFLSPDKQMED
jgi:anti-sigma regulatory factor (Ser/Thr protein kinase)